MARPGKSLAELAMASERIRAAVNSRGATARLPGAPPPGAAAAAAAPIAFAATLPGGASAPPLPSRASGIAAVASAVATGAAPAMPLPTHPGATPVSPATFASETPSREGAPHAANWRSVDTFETVAGDASLAGAPAALEDDIAGVFGAGLDFLDDTPMLGETPGVAAPLTSAPLAPSDVDPLRGVSMTDRRLAESLDGLPVLEETVSDDIRDILRAMGGDFAGMVEGYREGATLADVSDVPFELPRPTTDEGIDAVTDTETALVADYRDLKVFASPMGEGEHRTLGHLLAHMANVRATDLHLMIGQPPAFRLGGEIRRIDHEPLNAVHMDTFLWAVLTPEDLARVKMLSKRAADAVQMVGADIMHEIDVVYTYHGNRYRCNVAMEQEGPMLTIRLLPSSPPAIDGLNLPACINRLWQMGSGLVLIAGPTGAGKTTTLSALVAEYARRNAANIITIEEPIEYEFPRNRRSIVQQREVGRHTHSYATGVKAALRQDPDVIVIGEIFDSETMGYALSAARTGHLVFATIHASSAADIPQRVVDMFPAQNRPVIASQLAGVLELVTFQQLLPRLTGTDMVPAYEVVPMTTAVRANVDEMMWLEIKDNVRTAARQHGGVTMMESVKALTERGEVDAKIAMSVLSADDRMSYEREMKL